jgi:hypothetical protein
VSEAAACYRVHNTGHNCPRIVAALQAELAAAGPAMVQSHVGEAAGEVAYASPAFRPEALNLARRAIH